MLVFYHFHHYVRCHFLPCRGDEKPFTSGEVTMSKICLTPQALPDELEIWPIGLVRLRIYSKDTWAWRLDAKYFKNISKVFFVIIWSLKIRKMVIHWWFGSLFDFVARGAVPIATSFQMHHLPLLGVQRLHLSLGLAFERCFMPLSFFVFHVFEDIFFSFSKLSKRPRAMLIFIILLLSKTNTIGWFFIVTWFTTMACNSVVGC